MPKQTPNTTKDDAFRLVDIVDVIAEARSRLVWVSETLLAREVEQDSNTAGEEYGAIIVREEVERVVEMLSDVEEKYAKHAAASPDSKGGAA